MPLNAFKIINILYGQRCDLHAKMAYNVNKYHINIINIYASCNL